MSLSNPPRVLHLWGNYFPDLFDHSHRLCLAAGWPSWVAARGLFDSSKPELPSVSCFRRRTKDEINSNAFMRRAQRALLRNIDQIGFGQLTRRTLADVRPDLIHCHYGTTGAELLKWGNWPELPAVVSFYGVDASASLREPATVRRYAELGRRGVLAHVLCEVVANRLSAIGWPADQIELGNLPAQVEQAPDLGQRQGGGVRLLIPARFVEKKGHLVLLEALQRVVREIPDIQLTCFGYGPSAWLEEAIAKRNLSDRVHVIDNHQSSSFFDEYMAILSEHDIVVAPSIESSTGDDEGGPALTVVTAQSAGKPVVVSAFPGAERSVTDGVEGLVVSAGSPLELAEALINLSKHRDLWSTMGGAGRLRAQSEFSEAAYWKLLQRLYFQVLGR